MDRDFHFTTAWPRAHEGGIEALREWLEEHPRTRMIVIDTLVKFRKPSNNKANIYEEDSAALIPLQEMAAHYHVAIIVVQHYNKMRDADDWTDQISGSTGLSGVADTVMGLMKQRGASNAVLRLTGRDVSEADMALDFDPLLGIWKRLGNAQEVALSDERRKILAALAKFPEGAKARAITDRIEGARLPNVSRLLYNMVEADVLDVFQGIFKLKQKPINAITTDHNDQSDHNRSQEAKNNDHSAPVVIADALEGYGDHNSITTASPGNYGPADDVVIDVIDVIENAVPSMAAHAAPVQNDSPFIEPDVQETAKDDPGFPKFVELFDYYLQQGRSRLEANNMAIRDIERRR